MADFRILVLGGDGIGPEVTEAALDVLTIVADRAGIAMAVEHDFLHGAAYDRFGTFCRDETVSAALDADAILVGAVGGPKWDGIRLPGGPEHQDGLMRLRKALDAFAGLRPAVAMDCLLDQVPYRRELLAGTDILVLREMCGGTFFSEPRGIDAGPGGTRQAIDTTRYDEDEIARFAEVGFQLARGRRRRLCSADKANVMETGQLWRDVVGAVAKSYPDVETTHLFADNVSYQIARDPKQFDVILADNLFGDILSDQAGAVAGGLGMLPSACLCGLSGIGTRTRGIYEPVHGSAPDLAGKAVANPVGAIRSVALMAYYSFGLPDLARRIEDAISNVLASGIRTPDLGGTASTRDVTDAVIEALTP